MLLLKVFVALVFAMLGAVLVLWQTTPKEGEKTDDAQRYGTMAGVAVASGLFGFAVMHFGVVAKVPAVKPADILRVTIPTDDSALEAGAVTTAGDDE